MESHFDNSATNEKAKPRWFGGLVALFFVANFLALQLPHFVPAIRIPGLYWNWSGKILAIGLSCAILARSAWLRRNVGIGWWQAPGSLGVSLICFALCLGSGIFGGLVNSPVKFSAETLLFQLLMPTLDEELAFRGIGLAMLERANGQSPMSCRLRFGRAAFVLTVLFGLAHAVSVSHGHWDFDWGAFLWTSYFAAIVTVARTRSGSLLWPMLCHSGSNVALFAIGMMR